MFRQVKRWLRYFFRNTSTVNSEPINKVSLVVIVLVDLFILSSVFWGLSDVATWPISPNQQHPCYAGWSAYQAQTDAEKDLEIVVATLSEHQRDSSLQESYQRQAEDHLGQVSDTCLQYARYGDQLLTPENQAAFEAISPLQERVEALEDANRQIREQYDSTLLEEIAGQPRDLSINEVEAAEARQTLEANTEQIEELNSQVATIEAQILESPESQQFLAFLNDEVRVATLESQYDRATFWHPSVEILFQGLFLLPLLAIAWSLHKLAQRRNYGLVALLSWHLLVIFCVPLVIKLFEMLQVGVLFGVFADLLSVLLGSLLFLVSYLYIFLIPVIGFGLIKFFQRVILNLKVQAEGRVQKNRCIRCARKLQIGDSYCPHCGYQQFKDCSTCHKPTYRLLPYCRECGAPQKPISKKSAS